VSCCGLRLHRLYRVNVMALYLRACVSAIVMHICSCPVMWYCSVPDGLSWVTVDQSAGSWLRWRCEWAEFAFQF
jgi:hypothetical protein